MFWGCTPGRPPRAPQSLSPKLTTPTRVNLGVNRIGSICNKRYATNCVFLISDMIYQNILVTYSYIFDHLTLISIINILTDRLLFLPQGHRQNPHCMCLELGWIDKRIWILPILVRSSIITGIKILEVHFLIPPFCLNDLPMSAHLLPLKLPSSSEKMSFCKGQKMSKLTRSSSIKNPGSSEIKFQFETWNLNTASVSISFIICLSLISFMSTDIIQVFSLFNANGWLIHSIHSSISISFINSSLSTDN